MIDATVLAALQALTAAGVRATDGDESTPQRPYVKVDVVPGEPAASSLVGRRDRRVVDLVVHRVADSARAVRVLADRVEEALLDVRLDVEGRTCAPANRVTSTAPNVENSLEPSPLWATDIYRVVSYRSGS